MKVTYTKDFLEEMGFDTQELYDLGYIGRCEDKNIGFHICDQNGKVLDEEVYYDKKEPGKLKVRKIATTENLL